MKKSKLTVTVANETESRGTEAVNLNIIFPLLVRAQ